MRILMLTLIAPYPPDSGPKIKTYNVLQYLCERHEVTLVSLVRNEQERAHAESLRRICREVYTVPFQRSRWKDARFLLKSALTGESFILSRDASPELHQLLRQLTAREHFDIIHADQLNMAPFAVDLPGGHGSLTNTMPCGRSSPAWRPGLISSGGSGCRSKRAGCGGPKHGCARALMAC